MTDAISSSPALTQLCRSVVQPPKALMISLLAAFVGIVCAPPTSAAQGFSCRSRSSRPRGTPISSALIELRVGSQTVLSDVTTERGRAVFRTLAAGSYVIRVKRFGYRPLTAKIVIAPGLQCRSQTLAMVLGQVTGRRDGVPIECRVQVLPRRIDYASGSLLCGTNDKPD